MTLAYALLVGALLIWSFWTWAQASRPGCATSHALHAAKLAGVGACTYELARLAQGGQVDWLRGLVVILAALLLVARGLVRAGAVSSPVGSALNKVLPSAMGVVVVLVAMVGPLRALVKALRGSTSARTSVRAAAAARTQAEVARAAHEMIVEETTHVQTETDAAVAAVRAAHELRDGAAVVQSAINRANGADHPVR